MNSYMSRATTESYLPRFGINFLDDHARRIITDPKIALIELIANCWDAGANRVDITWPEESRPDIIEIRDDGTGMTSKEFTRRWLEFNYNRREVQGEDVIFPIDNQKSHRNAYGTNGKGRHSMFCFANEYKVETWKEGHANQFVIRRTEGISSTPYTVSYESDYIKDEHGTTLSAELVKNHLDVPTVHDLIGSKFVIDPSFKIYINGELVELTNLKHLINSKEIPIKGYGTVVLSCIDSEKTGRTSKQHGVAWWVNKRLVGEPSWKGFDETAYIDARTAEAKRYTYVVEADILADDVVEDWSDFKNTEKFIVVRDIVRKHILQWLRELMRDIYKSRKLVAISTHRKVLKELSSDSRYYIGRFVDEIQNGVSVLDQKVLEATITILSNLEKARSGYTLLEQLAGLNSCDLDELSAILDTWSVYEARLVLDELGRRLQLIKTLEKMADNPSSDELHDIQPIFEKGLWIFGPEYESLQFTSNKSLSTIIRKFFKQESTKLSIPRKRPDFVALPDSSIGIYTVDSYDERGEVEGLSKVLIVELKKGGFRVTRKEGKQAQDYASEIRKSGKIRRDTQIVGFVLGTTLAEDARDPLKEGEPTHTIIYPNTYSTILRMAHARTFDLQKKIEEIKGIQLSDPEIEQVLRSSEQSSF
jgi:hypothetical protein